MARATKKKRKKAKADKDGDAPARRVVARNRRALHRFIILDKFECGIVLTGPEVKSLRNGQGVITESFGRIRRGEVWLLNMEIGHYQPAYHVEQLSARTRKLLLHRREIRKLARRLDESGTTLVPLQIYFAHGLAKVQLALVRGAREHDKRERLKAREDRREIRASMQKGPRGRKPRRR